MSNEQLSLLFQIACLASVGLYSILYPNKTRNCLIVAVLAMLFANIVAQIVIAGDGPGACVGFVLLPTLGIVVSLICAHTTRFVGSKLKKREHK